MSPIMQPTSDPRQGSPESMPMGAESMPMGAESMQTDQLAGSGQPITEQQKQELMKMIVAVQEKLDKLKASRFAGNGKVEEAKQKLLQAVFQKMQMAGVDLTDRQSVAEFIDRLRQRSPELAQMFEEVMDMLLGPESNGVPQETEMVNLFSGVSDQPQSPADPTVSPADPTQSPVELPEQF